jgi:hypothetical protein
MDMILPKMQQWARAPRKYYPAKNAAILSAILRDMILPNFGRTMGPRAADIILPDVCSNLTANYGILFCQILAAQWARAPR